MFEPIRKEFFYAIIILLATAAVSYLYNRYTVNELDVNYSIMDIKMPAGSGLQKKNGNQLVNKIKVMRLLVKNQTEKPIVITSIESYGLKDFYGVNVSRLHNEQEEIYSDVVAEQFEKNEGKLILTHFAHLPSKREYEICILGDFFPAYVQVNSDHGIIIGKEASLMRGIDLFFARYWSLAIIVSVLFVVLVAYYYKSKNVNT